MKNNNRSLDDTANLIGDLQEGLIARLEKRGLKEVLRLQKKGIFLGQDMIPTEIYLEAADRGLSANLIGDGRVYFHQQTERVIEDPESQWQGCCADQIPPEPRMYNGVRGC